MNTIPTQFAFTPSSDGKAVVFTMTQANANPVSIGFPIDVIGGLVAGLLGASMACARLNQQDAQPFSAAKNNAKLAFAESNGVAVQEIPDKPDVVALCFAFGGTEIAIGINRAALQPLGTALMATSADRSQPQ